MNTNAIEIARSNTPHLSAMQDIPLSAIQESGTNPRRQFDEARLAELAAFVPGNKIRVMLRLAFCVRRLEPLCRQREGRALPGT